MQDALKRVLNLPAQLTKPKSGPSAQDFIKLPNAAIKFGVLRKKPKHSVQNKWPRCFVLLLKDSIYIYKDELAAAPKAQLSLQCFSDACPGECEAHEWSFSLVADSSFANVNTKTFACLSEDERLSWMVAINNQLLMARGDNAAYSDSYNSAGSYELSSSSDGSAGSFHPMPTALTSPPKRKPAVLPKPVRLSQQLPDQNLLQEEPIEENEYDFPVFSTLEDQCTVVNNDDREELLRQLMATNSPGTYLIRMTQDGKDKCLSLLVENYVKNYKIFRCGMLYSLDKHKAFVTIEDLLRHYTVTETMPNTNCYLQSGLYKQA